MNKPTEIEDRLPQRSRELFNEQVANLDGRTRSRLNQARQAALAAVRGDASGARSWRSRWLLPTGSVAALALVAVTTLQLLHSADKPLVGSSLVLSSSVDDVEILAADTELDLLQNMDFYAWLETQQTEAGDASEAG